ncbi:MAG: FAD-dependent oxidoreductase [Xanthobacteraceae bacterium]
MSSRLDIAGDRVFDSVVIGSGINGSAAALELVRKGYDVAVLDKGDFGGGTSSRSTRLLHLGLRYFANGSDTPIRTFLTDPKSLADALRMAKLAMRTREEFVVGRPERVNPLDVYFPINRRGSYRPYHLKLGFKALGLLGRSMVPINNRRLPRKELRDHGLLAALDKSTPLQDVFMFRDYQFDWPERIICDMILEVKARGGMALNYANVRSANHVDGLWHLSVQDMRSGKNEVRTVRAKSIVNLAGIWLDQVNGSISLKYAGRKITGTKGIHIAVKLPAGYENFALMTMSSHDQPIYCIPWKGIHYIGATETLFEGEWDKIVPEEKEVQFLLGEARILFPSLDLKREDVIYAWAGVRPWTYDQPMLEKYKREKKLSNPIGARRRELHDLSEASAPNVIGLTAGPIMLHRETGRDVAGAVQAKIGPPSPSRREEAFQQPVPADIRYAETGNLAQAVREAVDNEQAASLVDIMFRRLPFGWREDMGTDVVDEVGQVLREMNEWGAERVENEIEQYHAYLREYHLFEPSKKRN